MSGEKPTHSLAIQQFCEGPDSRLVSPEKVASHLGLSVVELARVAQIDPNAVQLRPSSTDVQRILREIIQVLSLAGEIFESSGSAIDWLLSDKVSAFKDETALTFICQDRTEDVILYLHSIE